MKLTHEQKLRRYLDKHCLFTIKDVVRVTNANNPYSVLKRLREGRNYYVLHHVDAINKHGVRFRIYHDTGCEYMVNRYIRRHNLKLV